ncbi:MAG: sugar-binding protein [Victivallaceae bacterium]
MMKLLITCFIVMGYCSWTGGAEPVVELGNTPLICAGKTITAPVLNGNLDDSCWQNSIEIAPFILADGIAQPNEQTVAYCTYDDNNLYVAFKCFDNNLNPDLAMSHKIKTQIKEPDSSSLWQDDCVELFIQPDDSADYFHFIVNAAGVGCDIKNLKDVSWNSGFKIAGSRTSSYWVIEMAIPLQSLTSKKIDVASKWRINFCREQKAYNEDSAWSPTCGSFLNKQYWGTLCFRDRFLEILQPQRYEKINPGKNTISFKIKSATAETIKLSAWLMDGNHRIVKFEEKYGLVENRQAAIDFKVEIPANISSLNSSGMFGFQYEISSAGSDIPLYRSPARTVKIGNYSPFQTNISLFDKNHDLFLAGNAAQVLRFDIQNSDAVNLAAADKLSLVIELPASVKIIDPVNHGRNAVTNPPSEMKVESVNRNGVAYQRYQLSYPVGVLYPMDKKVGWRNWLYLILYTDRTVKDNSEPGWLYYHAEAYGKKLPAEPERKIRINFLGELNGVQPRKYVILEWSTPGSLLMIRLTPQERDLMFDNWKNAGFNIKGLQEFGMIIYSQQDLAAMRNRGIEPMKAILTNSQNIFDPNYINMLPGAEEYLSRNPQFKAVNLKGETQNKIICMSHIIDPASGYAKEMEKWTADLARNYCCFMIDHEVPVFKPFSACFCERCLGEFSRQYKLSNVNKTKASLLYKEQWVDFQCRRNAAMAAMIRNFIHKANPNAMVMLYSGYEEPEMHEHAGSNLNYFGKVVDYMVCGYDRPLEKLALTKKILASTPLITSEIVSWEHGEQYDLRKVRVNLFRRITDGTGGLMVFYSPLADGRFWKALSDISRIVSQYEDFFIQRINSDDSIVLPEKEKDAVMVMSNKSNERLIFLFNETFAPKTFTVKNKLVVAGQVASAYYGGRQMAGNEFSVTVPPMDVEVITLTNSTPQ